MHVSTIGIQMGAQVFNSSMAQPELPQTWPSITSQSRNTLLDAVAGWHAWQYVVTFLIGVIIYDQGKYKPKLYEILQIADTNSSYVYQTEGFYRRTAV
jgi:hypothetical protein